MAFRLRKKRKMTVLVFLGIVIILISVTFSGCELILSVLTREVRIRNPYDAPVSLNISGIGLIEIPAYEYEQVRVSGDNVRVEASGKYFDNYSVKLDDGSIYHRLEADRGWIALENKSSRIITSPKFGFSSFSHDGNMNLSAVYSIPPGSAAYLPFHGYVSLSDVITFSFSGSSTRYKFLFPSYSRKEVGYTYTQTLYDFSTLDETY